MKSISKFLVLLSVPTILGLVFAATAFAGKPELPHEITVNKDGTGDFATITDALNAITYDPYMSPYTIKVGPGTYEESIVMKEKVFIVGSGKDVSFIQWSGPGPAVTTSNSRLEGFTIQGDANAARIYAGSSTVDLKDLKIVYGNPGIEIHSSTGTISDVELFVTGFKTGIYMQLGFQSVEELKLNNITIDINDGIGIYGSSVSRVIMRNVSIRSRLYDGLIYDYLTGIKVSGNIDRWEIYDLDVNLQNQRDRCQAIQVGITSGTVMLSNANLSTVNNWVDYGVELESGFAGRLEVSNSSVNGDIIRRGSSGSYLVGSSEIDGSYQAISGVDKITNSYDGNFNPIPNQ